MGPEQRARLQELLDSIRQTLYGAHGQGAHISREYHYSARRARDGRFVCNPAGFETISQSPDGSVDRVQISFDDPTFACGDPAHPRFFGGKCCVCAGLFCMRHILRCEFCDAVALCMRCRDVVEIPGYGQFIACARCHDFAVAALTDPRRYWPQLQTSGSQLP